MPEHPEMNRLDEALEVWLRHLDDAERDSDADLLARHESLRDLLEPLLRGEDQVDLEAGPGSPPAVRVLGDFHLRREIGRGGMGIVYEAWQASLDRRVAVKVLPASRMDNARAVARFKQEAGTVAKLAHKGIVEVYAVGQVEDTHYFAMEFVDGVPLDKVIAESGRVGMAAMTSTLLHETVRDALPRARDLETGGDPGVASSSGWETDRDYIQVVVEFVAQTADALAHAHEHGVIHRDVKPSNILVRPDGTVVLTDFGLARAESLPAMTLSGEFAGTPYDVSPEQATQKRADVDHRTDVFSLGVTLYELLTLRRPFDGETSQAVLHDILTREPTDPQRLNPQLAPDLAAVVIKAIEKNPAQRYASAAAFASDLRNFLAYRPVSARRLTRVRRLMRWLRREPVRAALAGSLLLGVPALSVLGGYVLASRDEVAAGEQAILEEDFESVLRLGFLKLAFDYYDEATAFFERALSISPGHAEAVSGLVMTWTYDGQPERALALITSLPEPLRTSPAMMRIHRLALRYAGRVEEGEELLKIMPARVTAHDYFIGGLLQMDSANASVHPAKWSRQAMNSMTRAIVRSREARPIYHYMRAIAAVGCKNHSTAKDAAETIQNLWPDLPDSFEILGYALSDIDPQRAREVYLEAIARDTDEPRLRLALGNIYFRAAMYAESEASLRKAIELGVDPKLGVYGFLAGIEMRTGDHSEGERLHRLNIQHKPSARNYCWLGEFFLEIKRPDKHLTILQEAVQQYPESSEIRHRLGRALREIGRHEEAVTHLRRASTLLPKSGPVHQELGLALTSLEDHAGAAAAYKVAAARMPNDLEANLNLGRSLRRIENFAAALAPLRRAAALGPTNAAAQYELSATLIRLDRVTEAMASIEATLELQWKRRLSDYLSLAAKVQAHSQRSADVIVESLADFAAKTARVGRLQDAAAIAKETLKTLDGLVPDERLRRELQSRLGAVASGK